MTTSFHVNAHDLEFILKQIRVSELQASGVQADGSPYTTVEAIMEVYGVSAADAALLPAGLRTVDGTDNNLLPGLEENGAAQTEFPRLTDPVYVTAAEGSIDFDGAGPGLPLVNGNYTPTPTGTGMNVVDTAPRVISNLVVDQSPANPAAVYAALKAVGVTGVDANAAVGQITTAYQGMLAAKAANAAANAGVTVAFDALIVEQGQHGAALAADSDAKAAVARFEAAGPLAATAAALADDAQVAADALAAELAAPTGANAEALYEAAVAAANAALAAAGDVVTALGVNVTDQVLAMRDGAAALTAALDPLDDDAVIDGADAAAADGTAATYAATSEAGSAAAVAAVASGLADATAAAAVTQAALDLAGAELAAANDAYLAAQGATGGNVATAAQAAAILAGMIEAHGLVTGPEGGLVIENISPDVGLTPSFNSFMTIFGQFFDHGLDLVNKGGNGTVYMPLEADDPLIAGADQVFGTADDLPAHLRFMTLTRATQTFDANGVAQHTNATTTFVDQNQTYTSHASHQSFLREYARGDVGGVVATRATGALLDGSSATGSLNGSIATWADIKAQSLEMLGIRLQDSDVGRVPLLATDAYGNLILGANGYAQMVMAPDATHATTWLREGTASGIATAGSVAAGPAFLVDIAHNASPDTTFDHDGNPATPRILVQADLDDVVGNAIATDSRGNKVAYDDELLDLHVASGDGRGNENIALQSVHSVFHSEHNRILEENKHTILGSGDVAFVNEWLLVDLAASTNLATVDADSLVWDGARMFQAARFTTEMQYQHMVFEEFARRIQPSIDPFVFTNSADIDASILAEFAHAVYRFGHSMLTDTVDRLGADLEPLNGEADQMSLIEAFLNPQAFTASGTNMDEVQAAFIRGLSSDVGNEIDEFIVPALQSNLLGLPLDLAALNIARGRETGVPSLNDTRAQLYNDFGLPDLKPYASWADFAQNLKNPISLINFVAAYGNHATIVAADTLEEKRAAASLLVLGGAGAPGDRLAFFNGTGAYGASNDRGGLDNVDLWIGGLAEKVQEFGGMLGATFGFIFEYQMEQLQNGDRFYYLSRTQGLNFLDALESNTFTDIVMRNSALGDDHATHISGNLFLTPDMILELDSGIAQRDYNGDDAGRDPTWDDPLLESFSPKVVRVDGVTVGGHQVGGELHFRGGEHVVLGGTEGGDILTSDLGDDHLWGDGGDDYLNGGGGADQVFGGDGDDVIEDLLGDNFLRGERGNDVVSSARGFNLSFGGQGKDVILIGQDAGEAFGGEGDDFMMGGAGADMLLGNEGNDWIEGGEGFDGIAGDNSELFFNSSIIGHDVAWGQGNDQDYDLESGDDIALSGIGVQRFEGMFGFDWASAKYDVAGANWNLSTPIFTTDPADILRDRFDLMEAMSGWKYADTMVGDDRGTAGGGLDPILDFDDHVLTQAGIDRIAGLNAWMAGARATLFGAGETTYRDGNIIMGGDGGDRMQGRGGFDLIDGDTWLNVRIRIVVDGRIYSAESLNSAQTTAGALSGKVFDTDAQGRPDFASPAFGGRSLTSLLLDRTISPGDMSIVREILTDATGGDIDTAVFVGNLDEYLIEGRGARIDLNGDGDLLDAGERVVQAAHDVNGDGFISVSDQGAVGRGNNLFDDTDLIRGIERLDFADQTVAIDAPLGLAVDLGFEPTLIAATIPEAAAALGRITSEGIAGTFALGSGSSAALAVSAAGNLGTVVALGNNQTHVLNLELTAFGLTSRETITLRTGSRQNNTMTGNAGDDIVYANGGSDVLSGLAGDDVLFGQGGSDTLNGGDGRDLLIGGAGNDAVNGGDGDDRILFVVGNGNDAVDGGGGGDILEVRGTVANETLTVAWNGTATTSMTGITAIAGIEEIRVDLLGASDRLAYTATSAAVIVDLAAGTATGLTSLANVSNVTGTNNADWMTGNAMANSLIGGGGTDTFVAMVDDVRDTFAGGAGSDKVDYSAYAAGLVVDLGAAPVVVRGTGSSLALSDVLTSVEELIGGSGDDQFSGTAAVNRFLGGLGDDALTGNGGDDVLNGGDGRDVLSGGANQDLLTGGLGEDRFVFTSVVHTTLAASDVILDFEGAGSAGGDVIDIGAMAGTLFSFIGTNAFATGASNQVRITNNGADTFLLLDTDADNAAEAQIRVTGLHEFGSGDFIL